MSDYKAYSALHASLAMIICYPTRTRGIIVNYQFRTGGKLSLLRQSKSGVNVCLIFINHFLKKK